MADHVHMLISIPPKHAVSDVIGLHQRQERDSHRAYFVSTMGRDEKTIRDCIRNQEAEDKRMDQMKLWTDQ